MRLVETRLETGVEMGVEMGEESVARRIPWIVECCERDLEPLMPRGADSARRVPRDSEECEVWTSERR